MAAKLDYRWRVRTVMAERGMFATTDLIEPLARRSIGLSSSQVYRLVVIATARRPGALRELTDTYPDRLQLEPLDVTDPAEVTVWVLSGVRSLCQGAGGSIPASLHWVRLSRASLSSLV